MTKTNIAERRRENSRQKIVDAATMLFYEKGYSNTTTRDIIRYAGVLNGSLYNRFKSKEDILLSIVGEALSNALDESEKLLDENDPMVTVLLPEALEIYLSCKDSRAARLLFEAHGSWRAAEMYVRMFGEWAIPRLEKFGYRDDGHSDLRLVAIVGATGNICGNYANGGSESFKDSLSFLIMMAAGLFGFPVFNIDNTVNSLEKIMTSSDITICGYRINSDTMLRGQSGFKSN